MLIILGSVCALIFSVFCTGADPGFFEGGGAGLAGLLRNLQSLGRSHTPPR